MHSHPLHRSNYNLIRDGRPRIINITDTNTYGIDTQFLASSIQYLIIYHTSNTRECMGVNGEALQLHILYKKSYFLLQVTWESVSGTASHAQCVWTCNEIRGLYDKIDHYHHTTKLYWKKNIVCCIWHCYSCCTLVTTQTATNSWYYMV